MNSLLTFQQTAPQEFSRVKRNFYRVLAKLFISEPLVLQLLQTFNKQIKTMPFKRWALNIAYFSFIVCKLSQIEGQEQAAVNHKYIYWLKLL